MIPPLLRKELAWGRRRIVPLLVIFVLLPGAFAYGTVTFGTVLPTDAPVAVVPTGESVSDDELDVTEAAVTSFSQPVRYEDDEAAFSAMDREQVYAVVTVPPGVLDESETATFDVYVSGSIVPYHQASEAVVSVMNLVLRTQLPAEMDVQVERHVVGVERSLSSYLIPTFLLGLLMFVALAYLPYNLAADRPVLDRVRVESSLAAAVGWKLAFFTALSVVPVLVFQTAATALGYGAAVAAPGALVVYLLTFLSLGALGLAVTLASRFETWGRLVNVVGFLFLVTFSGLFYPAGFFSAGRRELVRLLPTHYAAVATRGYALRSAPLGLYADWIAGLAAVAVCALVALYGAARLYERE